MKIAAISIADYSEATEGMPHDVERLYFRMLLKMHARESGLPDDDDDNARIFGYRDVRTYKALKARLAKWPDAIKIEDGFIVNSRVEKEVETVKERRAEAAKNGQNGGRSKADRAKIDARSDGDRPEIAPRSRPEVRLIPDTTNIKNNDLTLPSPSPLRKKEESKEEYKQQHSQVSASEPATQSAALPVKIDLKSFGERLTAACNGSLDNPVNCMGLLSLSVPQMWIEQGCDLERDVIPTLTAAGVKHHGKRIRTWEYFTPMIAEARAKRVAGLPMVTAAIGTAAPRKRTVREILAAGGASKSIDEILGGRA